MKPFLGVIVLIALGTTLITTTTIPQPKSTYAVVRESGEAFHIHINPRSGNAPIATAGDNTYIAWWTNDTGNDEVMFRASTDGGTTFSDKINLSNSTDADSFNTEIAAEGDDVIITWWERNSTSTEPVVRISTDNGATFGPLLRLVTNGTVG